MQAKMPSLIAAAVEGAPTLDQILRPDAVHRAACAQAALVLLTQFSGDGEVSMSDVAELAGYIDGGAASAGGDIHVNVGGVPDAARIAETVKARLRRDIENGN